jgi:hypothetical protein
MKVLIAGIIRMRKRMWIRKKMVGAGGGAGAG